jgi:uridine phosphorylase
MFKEIFETIEFESENREMHALTGTYHGTRMTALSTGMGCDNIDIVMTELDAALRVENGKWEVESDRHLQIVRIGTSGSLQEDIDCGSHVASAYAIGLDGLLNYYKEWQECGSTRECKEMEDAFINHLFPCASHLSPFARPYCVEGSKLLLDKIAVDMHHGITATAPGFYGPQGRTIRLHPAIENLNEKLASFSWTTQSLSYSATQSLKVTNLEMETSAIYGFSHLMGHEALTVCLIIANCPRGTFLNDYHKEMRELVGTVVERMSKK